VKPNFFAATEAQTPICLGSSLQASCSPQHISGDMLFQVSFLHFFLSDTQAYVKSKDKDIPVTGSGGP
jgi:hypothetical protein